MRRNVFYRRKGDARRSTCFAVRPIIKNSPEHPIRYIIDGGANIGDQTVRFCHFYKDARIIAVEADAGNCQILRDNFAGDDGTSVVEAAVWNRSGTVNLNSGENSVSHTFDDRSGGDTAATTVGELLEKFELPYVDILKLDIEGAEIEVFGSADAWADRVNAVIVEPHDRMRNGCGFAIVRAFLESGFNLFVFGENLILIKRGWNVGEPLYYVTPSGRVTPAVTTQTVSNVTAKITNYGIDLLSADAAAPAAPVGLK